MSNGAVFTEIASKYDRLNRILSLGQDQNWRRRVVVHLPAGRILDLGAGTGAANPIFGDRSVVALDPSAEMLRLNSAAEKTVGMGEDLPFDDGSFDAVFSAFVVRNLDSVPQTLSEIHRVLRDGGRAGILDVGRPASPWKAALHRVGSGAVLPLIGLAVSARQEYAYLRRSLGKVAQPDQLYGEGPLKIVDLFRMGPLGFVYGVVLQKEI